MTIGYNPFDEDFSLEDLHEYRAMAISLREENLRLKKNLKEYKDKIEQGTLIECNPKLIGECIIGIQQYTDGTYAMDLDENIVIGFCSDGIVTANTTRAYNDYFKHGLYFIDNEKGRAEANQKLKELQE